MGKQIQNQAASVEEPDINTSEVEVDDTAEISKDAQDLADGKEISETETPAQSIAAALKEVEDGQASDGNQDEAPEKETGNAFKSEITTEKTQKASKEKEFDRNLLPPERFDLAGKEAFNRLPKNLKQEINRSVKDAETKMHEATTRAANAEKDNRAIYEVTQPYAAEFGRVGLSIPQGVAQLLSTHTKLMDPKTRQQTYVALGKDLGIDVAKLGTPEGGAQNGVEIDNHPVVVALKNEIRGLQEKINPIHTRITQETHSQNENAINAITFELDSVVNAIDQASGKYINPKLHDTAFRKAWEPLVSGIVGSGQARTYTEAGQMAYDRLVGRSSSNPNQARLSAQNTQNRSVTAANSLRGRNSSSTPAGGFETEISPNETAAQSIQRALQDITNGRGA